MTKRVGTSLLLLFLTACSSGGDTVTPINRPPTVAFTFAKLAVPRAIAVDLTISATDPDGDKLTIDWTITRNTLTAQNTAKTIMRWDTPATVGVDTVNIHVTDGTFNRNVSAVVKVGWLTTPQPPAYALSLYEKAKSPYIVVLDPTTPTLIVPANTTTTIQAGTEILIDTPESIINVLGRLSAQGTAGEPVIIHPNNRTFVCSDSRGWWEGIGAATDDAEGSDGRVELDYTEVWYAQDGVRLRDNSAAILRNCSFRCSGDNGVLMEGNGFLRLFDSDINNGRGNGVAIAAFASLPDSVRIEGCTIGINGNAGIRMDLIDPTQSVPIAVEFNAIQFNAVHGITLANAVFPQIHHNHFRGNGGASVSNIYLMNGYPGAATFPTLDATCNYWGAPVDNQETIDATIRDELDAPGNVHTRVTTCPWLDQDPLTTTPNCSMSCP